MKDYEYFISGNIKSDFGDFQGAIQDYNKAIELNPNHADAYCNRGVVKYELTNYQCAMQDYTKTIELDSKSARAYNNRGNAKFKLNDCNTRLYRGNTT